MLNTIPCTPKDVFKILDLCFAEKLSVILWGSTGIGKTQIIEQWAAELAQRDAFKGKKPQVWGAHLATIEATDIKGMIVPDVSKGVSTYLPPEFLPPEGDENGGVVFFDEINRGEPRLQNAVFQILQDRRCGKRRIGDNFLIVAAANNAEMSEAVYSMDPALADRLVHIHVVADVDSWCAWGMKPSAENPAVANIDPRVLAFIRTSPQYIDGCEKRVKAGTILGYSPRGWHRVSRVLRRGGDKATMMFAVNGIVGKEAAVEFFLVLANLESNVEVEKIMAATPAERAKMLPKTKVGLYRLAYALIGAVKDGPTAIRAIEIVNSWRQIKGDEELPISELQTLAAENIFEKADKVKALEKLAGSKTYDEYIAHRPKHASAA